MNERLRILDLRTMDYGDGLARQHAEHKRVVAGEASPCVLLLEHEAVITVTPRLGAREHILASPQRLAELGVSVAETDRGGDVTLHAPGQLVAYPILPLNDLGLNIGRYMRWLESVVIETVSQCGIEAERVEGCTGVWVRCEYGGAMAKLCALGVRVRRGVTLHGLALNVCNDLSLFDLIVPCGLANRRVTSLRALLGETVPTMAAVKQTLAERMREAISEPGRPRPRSG